MLRQLHGLAATVEILCTPFAQALRESPSAPGQIALHVLAGDTAKQHQIDPLDPLAVCTPPSLLRPVAG